MRALLSVNHLRFRSPILALLVFLAAAVSGAAQDRPPYDPSGGSGDRAIAAGDLAGKVRAIADSNAISHAKKEKRIATVVRVAVVADIAYKSDPGEVLAIALELTEAAARAAPGFAEVIASAVSFAPPLTRINSAPSQIRSAAFAAARAPRDGRPTRTARPPTMVTRHPPAAPPDDGVPAGEPAPRTAGGGDETAGPVPAEAKPSFSIESNHSYRFTAEASARYDDNVFLTEANKVDDTIVSLAPGVEFHFGQDALAHGGLSYREAFTRYLGRSAPNVNLGLGAADFGYDNGNTAVIAAASYQQLYQNDASVAALGQKEIFRRDNFTLDASVEPHLSPKTSVKVGADFSSSEYKNAGLIGSRETAVPVKFYYETTPKVSVSAGAEYRQVKPQDGGPDGKDLYYNVGARGNVTPKLTGEVSAGYRTRRVGANPTEHLFGFDGSLNYEVTAKTGATLAVSRDFSTGALGESLKNSSYSFRVSSDPTPQWQFSSALTYRNVEYGPTLFRANNVLIQSDRLDKYWEGSLLATYIYSTSLSATADYTFRNNGSTAPGVRFSNNLLSLSVDWSY